MVHTDGLPIRIVAQRVGLSPTTIRFYESKFGFYIRVPRSSGGHRRYKDVHIQRLLYIKYLLKTRKLTVEQVRKRLLQEIDPRELEKIVEKLEVQVKTLEDEVMRLKQALQALGKRVLALEELSKKRKPSFFGRTS